MVVTDDARDVPNARLVLPDVHEFADAFAARAGELAEPVRAGVNRAPFANRPHLQCACDELTPELAEDVTFDVADELVAAPRDAAFVMVELKFRCEVARELFQIAAIKGVEHCFVQCLDSAIA